MIFGASTDWQTDRRVWNVFSWRLLNTHSLSGTSLLFLSLFVSNLSLQNLFFFIFISSCCCWVTAWAWATWWYHDYHHYQCKTCHPPQLNVLVPTVIPNEEEQFKPTLIHDCCIPFSLFFFRMLKRLGRERELDGRSAVANNINYLALLNIGWDVGKKKKSDFDGDWQGSLKLRDCFSRLFLSRLNRSLASDW